MIKVLLINPPGTANEGFYSPPLGLLYLAGMLLENDFKVEVIDGSFNSQQKIKRKIKDYQPTIVGISCFTATRIQVMKIARITKAINKNILTVIGGMHATHMYEQILSHYPSVDICVLGEGEKTLLEICQGRNISKIHGIAYRDGNKVIKTKPREIIEDMDSIPMPAWHLIDFKKYLPGRKQIINGVRTSEAPQISITFSRGCVGYCSFCAVWRVWGKFRHRSIKKIVDEIDLLNNQFGVNHFSFVDDAFTIDKQAVLGMCREINRRSLKIVFSVITRADCVDEEVLLALKNAGCHTIFYGVESASPVILKKMNKPIDIEITKKAIALTKKFGIKSFALLIVGYFGETIETFNQTIEFLNQVQPERWGTRPGLIIYPGTVDYFRCKKLGFINDNFWLNKKRQVVYTGEYNILQLMVFYIATLRKQKISDNWVLNYFRHLPYYIRHILIVRYLPEPIRVAYHNLKVSVNSILGKT